jgi:hypothetical protein
MSEEYKYEELTHDQVRAMIDKKKGAVDLWVWDSNPAYGVNRRIIAVAYNLPFSFIGIENYYMHAGIRREKPKKWEPPKDDKFLSEPGIQRVAEVGMMWPTEEKARLAHERNVFRQRLDRLAEDLQGSVGGVYEVAFHYNKWVATGGKGSINGILNSSILAERAAEIMNRDGWKMPAGLGGVE